MYWRPLIKSLDCHSLADGVHCLLPHDSEEVSQFGAWHNMPSCAYLSLDQRSIQGWVAGGLGGQLYHQTTWTLFFLFHYASLLLSIPSKAKNKPW